MPSPQPLDKNETFSRLPPVWQESLLPQIQSALRTNPQKVIVLDDDPTGTQTVHDVPVLTTWDVESLAHELENDLACFYILTNSRSMSLAEAEALNTEIGNNLSAAFTQTGRAFEVVSRSDSTLRGHFPGEVTALARAVQENFDGWLLIPFFLEGGRFTLDDVHYVAEGSQLTPAGETQFARDRVFGYRASDLREWVEEKTGGAVRAEDVAAISLDDLRRGGPARVTEKLLELRDGRICIVNAAAMRDMEILVAGLLDTQARGKKFLYRSAASFVQTRIGQVAQPLLTAASMELAPTGGGLIVVGSYVPKTTEQLNELLKLSHLERVEIQADALLDERREAEIARVLDHAGRALTTDRDIVIYTSRRLLTSEQTHENLTIGNTISQGLVEIVRRIRTRPRYLIAKGGITSSDVATQGLGVKRAIVRGQILPGIPVWKLSAPSRFPDLNYIVFPGNVGGPTALAEVVNNLRTN